MRLRWDGKNKKIGDKNFPTFTAGSKVSSITRVIGVIEQFSVRRYASFSDALSMRWRNKKLLTFFFSTFTAGNKINVIFVHNSGNRCDRTVRFVAYATFLDRLVMLWRNKQVAQRATIAHLSPMCQHPLISNKPASKVIKNLNSFQIREQLFFQGLVPPMSAVWMCQKSNLL